MAEGQRTRFLMHWTGKRWDPASNDRQHFTSAADYIELLDLILSGGLQLRQSREMFSYDYEKPKPPREPGHPVRRRQVYSHSPRMTCFTEVRLSHAKTHAEDYGRLGIGFTRDFVLSHFGGPVMYTRGRGSDIVPEHVRELSDFVEKVASAAMLDGDLRREAQEHLHRGGELLAFVKSMTDVGKDAEDFTRLHEHEWRILETARLKKTGKLRVGEHPAIPIQPDDVRILVFPNTETRALALNGGSADPGYAVRTVLRNATTPPLVLTLDEADQL